MSSVVVGAAAASPHTASFQSQCMCIVLFFSSCALDLLSTPVLIPSGVRCPCFHRCRSGRRLQRSRWRLLRRVRRRIRRVDRDPRRQPKTTVGGSPLLFFWPMAVDVVCTQTSDFLPLYSGRMIPCDVIKYFKLCLFILLCRTCACDVIQLWFYLAKCSFPLSGAYNTTQI